MSFPASAAVTSPGPRQKAVDFIDEQRSAVSHGNETLLGRFGVGERSTSVAEQFILKKVLGHCAAVDGNERSAAPLTQQVNHACTEFLSSSRFSSQKHRRFTGSKNWDLRQYAGKCLLFPDHFAEPSFAEERVLHCFERS